MKIQHEDLRVKMHHELMKEIHKDIATIDEIIRIDDMVWIREVYQYIDGKSGVHIKDWGTGMLSNCR